MPFKEDAWAFVNHRSRYAEKAGAVNVIWFDEHGESHGDNTDGIGLINDLQGNDIHLPDKRVLILGAGGAVRGVMEALLQQGVKSIVIVNRTLSRAQELAKKYSLDGEVRSCAYDAVKPGSVDIIINGTSASLQTALPPLDAGVVAGTSCYDLAYADTETRFVTWAKNNGAVKVVDGLGMLVQQAAESFYLWRGVRPDTRTVFEILKAAD